jgi:hypothetical protein
MTQQLLHYGYLQKLKLRAMNSKKACVIMTPKFVGLNIKLNLSHMEVPLCSGVSFQAF